jgi:hypothetical protein
VLTVGTIVGSRRPAGDSPGSEPATSWARRPPASSSGSSSGRRSRAGWWQPPCFLELSLRVRLKVPAPQAAHGRSSRACSRAPWGLVLSGAGLRRRMLWGLAFVGVLPLSSWPRSSWAAACAASWRRAGDEEGRGRAIPGPGGVGPRGGEGLARNLRGAPRGDEGRAEVHGPAPGGLVGELGTVALLLAVCAFLYLSAKRKRSEGLRNTPVVRSR